MCLDPERRQLFLLGRYLDTVRRNVEKLKSDFYVYDIDSDKWTLISDDTAAVGGPELIFDHQMLMDVEKQTIYIFGGRILTPQSSQEESTTGESSFSGLFSYHVPTGTWKKLACDQVIKSRVGHSMLFHPVSIKELNFFFLQKYYNKIIFFFRQLENYIYLLDKEGKII